MVQPVNASYLHERLPKSKLDIIDAGHFLREDAADGSPTAASMRRAEKRSAFRLSPKPGHAPTVPDYRRNWVAGGTFFFTVNLPDRHSDLLVAQIATLRDEVRQVRARVMFHIAAWVVLPNHIHCRWILPEDDADFPGRWGAIKRVFRNPYASVNRDHRS